MQSSGAKIKRVPLRTCIGCRQVRPQKELVRLCLNNMGEIEIDLEKRKPGRGAYLCPKKECWIKGFKKDRLEYTLKAAIAPEALKPFQEKALLSSNIFNDMV